MIYPISSWHEMTLQAGTILSLLHFYLQKDFEGQAVLINCLLRNYLQHNLYDQVRINFQTNSMFRS